MKKNRRNSVVPNLTGNTYAYALYFENPSPGSTLRRDDGGGRTQPGPRKISASSIPTIVVM